jgi:hexosaminidase
MMTCDEGRLRRPRGWQTALYGAITALGLTPAAQAGDPAPAVIPQPASIVPGRGAFRIGTPLDIVEPPGDAAAERTAHELAELLSFAGGLPLRARQGGARDGAVMLLRRAAGTLGAEGYRLSVTPQRVTIEAENAAGWFYGGITLWQLAQSSSVGTSDATFEAQVIEDRPRLAWRGLLLDSARHYQSPAFIGHLLDWMALHKLNVLHWHLTDDQGWRMEVRKYPALTAVGAYRVPAGAAAAADIDPATGAPRRYGGFYRQDEIRSLVAHAAHRHITIVPEIDLPGHASAAIASYPWLGVRPDLVQAVPSDWGVFSHVYSPEESTFRFLEDVLAEVLELFPGPYVHIGGDEVVIDEWQHSPRVAERLRELGLHSPADLHGYFAARVERFLREHGRRAVGWDENLEPTLSRSAVVMSWRGTDGVRAATARGNDVVLAPDPALYFDHRQGAGLEEPPGRVAVISLKDVYQFEPLVAGLDAGQQRHVLGLQANLWTEHVRTEPRVAAMAFPRLAALAEVGWSDAGRRNWPDFERRIAVELGRYRKMGLPFDESLFGINGSIDYAPDGRTATVTLRRQADLGVIRYTDDGTEPTSSSSSYSDPLSVAIPREIRAASFSGEQRLSSTRVLRTSSGLAGRRASGELNLCSSAVALALEDDAPREGPRAVFVLDIENPCWIWHAAPLDRVTAVAAAVGQVPFNFQIGADRDKIRFATPTTPHGELEVRLDGCNGELYARLPLAPAVTSNAVTVLPEERVRARAGVHDLCLRFAQKNIDPLWALDWIELRTTPVPGRE